MTTGTRFWKPFGASAIGSKDSLFFGARMRLTLFYVAVIAILLAVFSVTFYWSFVASVRNDVEGDFPSEQSQDAFIAKTVGRVANELVLADGAVLVFVGALGFWLAGRTLRPIKQVLDSQRRFIADASHELRTPLTIMKTELEVSQRREDAEGARSALYLSTFEEVERMRHLVDDLLTLSRIDSDQGPAHFSAVDLSGLTLQGVDRMGAYARSKAVTIAVQAGRPISVPGDADELRTVLINLLKNAIDYSPANGTVTMTLASSPREASLVVTDKGVGIASEDLPHVFERFFRADKSRSRRRGGSGLGLPIVESIVRRHRGHVSIQSLPGQGTIVTVSLPLIAVSS